MATELIPETFSNAAINWFSQGLVDQVDLANGFQELFWLYDHIHL